MPLVDYYASSDEEDDDEGGQSDISSHESLPSPSLNKMSGSSSSPNVQEASTLQSIVPSIDKLPDASLLLNSPLFASQLANFSDHSSHVVAAVAENLSRKRNTGSSVIASDLHHRKFQKGTSPRSKNVPDLRDDLFLPPQLQGRSNIVTEDINKLFANRRT